jgi:hypothetical protein
MQDHLHQARHNQNFISDCTVTYPDAYFDWKVTATFYTALHLLRAFCVKRKVNPGRTHHDIANSLNPKRANGKQLTQFPQHVWDWYSSIQIYSEQARYDGFLDYQVENEIQRDNFIQSQELLAKLKTYFTKQGVSCDIEEAA